VEISDSLFSPPPYVLANTKRHPRPSSAIFNCGAKIRAEPVCQHASVCEPPRYVYVERILPPPRSWRSGGDKRARGEERFVRTDEQPTYWLIGASEREESSFGHGCSRWHAIPPHRYAIPPPAPRRCPYRDDVYACESPRPRLRHTERMGRKERQAEGQIECHRVDVWLVLFRDGSDRAPRGPSLHPRERSREEEEERRGERDGRRGKRTHARARARSCSSLALSLSLSLFLSATATHRITHVGGLVTLDQGRAERTLAIYSERLSAALRSRLGFLGNKLRGVHAVSR